MDCAICGKQVPENSTHCPNCGTAVRSTDPAPPWSPALGQTPGSDRTVPMADALVLEPLPGEFRSAAPSVTTPASHEQNAAGYAAASSGLGSRNTGYATDSSIPGRRAPRRHKALIVIAIVLAVLLGGGFVAYQVFGREIRRAVLGPKKSYLMLEATALKGSMNQLAGGLAGSEGKVTPKAGGAHLDLSFKLASSLPGVDPNLLKLVNSLVLKQTTLFDTRQDGPQYYLKTDILTGGEQLVSAEAFVAKDQLTLGFPGLIQQYIAFPAADLERMIEESSGMDVSFDDILNQARTDKRPVDRLQLAAALAKVADVLLENIEDATFADGVPVTAGSVTQAYECYTVTSTGRQLRDMAVGILTLARDEQALVDLLFPLVQQSRLSGQNGFEVFGEMIGGLSAPRNGPMTEAEWKALLTEGIDKLGALKDEDLQDVRFTQKVYFDRQDRVHGRAFTVERIDGEEGTAMLQVLNPVKDGQHGLLVAMTVTAGDNAGPTPTLTPGDDWQDDFDFREFQIVSNYETANGTTSGTADIMANGRGVMTATFRDVAMAKIGEDDFTVGSLDLNMAADAVGSDMPIPRIGLKGEVSGSHYVLGVDVANFASLTADVAMISESDARIPSLSGKTMVKVTDEEGLASLMTFDVQMKLLQILQKIGLDPMSLF